MGYLGSIFIQYFTKKVINMAGKINKQLLNKQIFNNRAVKKMVQQIVNKEVEKQKNIMINEFTSHPVSKEIENGENSANSSGTLGGYGNLFSFIGFQRGFNPLDPILNLLKTISVQNVVAKNTRFEFKINIPSREEFFSVSQMPWETGRSWLFDMEKSISGLGEYLYGISKNSRSGAAVQSKKNIFQRTFRPVSYFNTIYNKFIKRLGL